MGIHNKDEIINKHGFFVTAIHERISANSQLETIPVELIAEWEWQCMRLMGISGYLISRSYLFPKIMDLIESGDFNGKR